MVKSMTVHICIDTLLNMWCLLQNTHCQNKVHESPPTANRDTSPGTVTHSTKKHHRVPHSTHGGNPGPWA